MVLSKPSVDSSIYCDLVGCKWLLPLIEIVLQDCIRLVTLPFFIVYLLFFSPFLLVLFRIIIVLDYLVNKMKNCFVPSFLLRMLIQCVYPTPRRFRGACWKFKEPNLLGCLPSLPAFSGHKWSQHGGTNYTYKNYIIRSKPLFKYTSLNINNAPFLNKYHFYL